MSRSPVLPEMVMEAQIWAVVRPVWVEQLG